MTLIKIHTMYTRRIDICNIKSNREFLDDPVLACHFENDRVTPKLTVYHDGSDGYINLNCVAEIIPFDAPVILNEAKNYSAAEIEIRKLYTLRRTNGQNLGLNGTNYSAVIDEESVKKIMAQAEIIN